MCFCKIQTNNMLKCPPCIIFYFALYVCFILHKKFIQERTFLNLLSSNFKDGYISNHRNKSQAGNLQSCKELKIISRKHSWTRNKHLILLSQITEQGVQSVYLLLFKISAGLNVLLLCQNPSELTGWIHVFWRLKMGSLWKSRNFTMDSSCVLLTPKQVRILTAKSFRFF